MFWYGNQQFAWVEKLIQEKRTRVYIAVTNKMIAMRICLASKIDGNQDQKNICVGKK